MTKLKFKPRDKASFVDIDPQGTQYTGLKGLYETLLRRFKTTIYVLTILPLYCAGGLFLGLALWPGVALFQTVTEATTHLSPTFRYMFQGLTIGVSYFICGLTLMTIVPFFNFVFRLKPKTFRGPFYSVDFVRWFIHNSILYLVRYTCLELFTPTPFNLLFYRMMGMKMGKGTQINTTNISDPALITLGERVTIGGSATIVAHYGQGGYLVLAPVEIQDDVTIGLKALVMGGVKIGKNAKVLPHSVVMPKTVIGPGEIWGGVPAERLHSGRKSKAA